MKTILQLIMIFKILNQLNLMIKMQFKSQDINHLKFNNKQIKI